MAMDKINSSPLLRPSSLDTFQTTRKGEDRPAGTGSADAGAPAAGTQATADKAEISAEARQLVDLRQAVDAGREALAALPDVRQERVADARQKLQAGFYNSSEVLDQVAEKLGKVLAAIPSA